MTVLVSLTPAHVQAVREARVLLARMAAHLPDYSDRTDPLVDQLGDILDLARAEEAHSVDYRRVAEDGARLMSRPTEVEFYPTAEDAYAADCPKDGARLMAHDGPYPPDSPKNQRYAGLVADVFDLREKGR